MLNSSYPTTTKVHDEFRLLYSHLRDGEAKWRSSFKILREYFFTEGYWEWVNEVLGRHGPFLKGCKLYEAIFASLFNYDCHASMIRAYCECWCPTINSSHTSIRERFPSLFGTCILLLDYPSLDLFMMRWYRALKSYLMM